MTEPTTVISLPQAVAGRWEELLEHFSDESEAGERDEPVCDPAIIRQLNDAPLRYHKRGARLELPYLGREHRLTLAASHVLKLAIYDAYDLRQEISDATETRLQLKRERWVAEGVFRSEAKPRAKVAPELQDFRREVEQAARDMILHASALLRQPGSPVTVGPTFGKGTQLTMSWHPNRQRSYGGFRKSQPFVSLALSELRPGVSRYAFHEYRHIAGSPVIGSCAGPWRVRLAVLVAHELAHAVQHSVLLWRRIEHCEASKDCFRRAHGTGWQEVYRYLREHWVNRLDGFSRAG